MADTPRKEEEENQESDYDFLDLSNLDLNFYDDLLSTVPSDCVSVELMLHCMLEQVSSSTTPSGAMMPPNPSKPVVREDGLDASLAEHLSGLLLKLALNEDEKKVSNFS